MHNNLKLETSQMLISGGMHTQWHIHMMEYYTVIKINIDWEKPDTKQSTINYSITINLCIGQNCYLVLEVMTVLSIEKIGGKRNKEVSGYWKCSTPWASEKLHECVHYENSLSPKLLTCILFHLGFTLT